MPRKGVRGPANYWTSEELSILGSGLPTRALAELLPGRSVVSLINKRRSAFGMKWTLTRFSQDEVDLLTRRFAENVPMDDIAAEMLRRFGTKRSVGTLRQKILKLSLTRDSRKTRLAQKFGHEVLGISDDPLEIAKVMANLDRQETLAIRAKQNEKITKALDGMMIGIEAGLDRAVMFQAAMMAGATLQQVGDRVGLTRERIRQVTSKAAEDVKYQPEEAEALFEGIEPKTTVWTTERVDYLQYLWANNFSASEIALKLGNGITRNAVLGKLHRLGLMAQSEDRLVVDKSLEEMIAKITPFNLHRETGGMPALSGKSRAGSYIKYNEEISGYDFGIIIYNWDDRSKDEVRKMGEMVTYEGALEEAEKLAMVENAKQ